MNRAVRACTPHPPDAEFRMPSGDNMPAPLAAIVAIAAVGIAGTVGVVAVTSAVNASHTSDSAVVERVIDGDTIDVRIDGTTDRVRLLNIDAPEDNKVKGVTECMGAEATAKLGELLPSGTEVTLKYDADRRDKYDRLLAGVFVGEVFVNAEMVRAGLAGTLVVGGNDRFFDDVSAAGHDAVEANAGIFGAGLPCALGAVVSTYQSDVAASASAPLPSDSASLTTTVDSAAALVAAAVAADAAIDAIDWIDVDVRSPFHAGVATSRDDATRLQATVTDALTTAKNAEAEAARIAAEQAEAARVAAEQAEAQRQAAAKAEADRRAAEAARQSSGSGGSSGGSTSSGGSGSSGSTAGGYDGYTGCRAYGGGYVPNAVDEKGRLYTKIDCTTKLPIAG